MTTDLKRLAFGVLAVALATGCHDDFTIPDEPVRFPDASVTPPVSRYPETTLVAKPAEITNQRTITFEFSSDRPSATFVCTLDGFDVYREPCTSPYTVTKDRDGAHSFEVAAVDSYYEDRSPEKFSWTLDTVPPHATLNGPPPVDNTASPLLYFDVETGGTARCTLDGRTPVTCTSPYHAEALAEGTHSFRVVVTDAAGNVDPTPPSVVWVFDATTSDTVIDSGPADVVTDHHQVFTFSSPDAAPGARFVCTRNGFDLGFCESPYGFDVSDGTYTFTVRVVEVTGNTDPTPASRTWTVDATPPGLAFSSAPGDFTSDNTPTFAFTADQSATGVECRLGAAAFAPCTSPVTLDALADGVATFEIRARDAAGNAGTKSRTFTVDTTPPVVTFTAGPGELGNNPSPTFEFTAPGATTTCQINQGAPLACTSPRGFSLGAGTFTITVKATDAAGNTASASRTTTIDTTAPSLSLGGPTATADATPTYTFTTDATGTLTCSLDSAAFAACASPFTTAALALGTHSFVVHSTDAAGNLASRFQSTFVDPRPLSVAITTGPFGEISQRRPDLTWASTGAMTESCRYDAASFGSCATALATMLADGPHTFEVKVTNDLGGVQSATRSFTVDTVAPLATITAGPSGTITTPSVSFEFTTSGAPVATECRLLPGGMGNGPYAACGSPASFELAAPGPYVFEVRVRDAAGNQWSAYRELTFSP